MTKQQSERSSGRVDNREASSFNRFTDDFRLREFSLINASLTHKSTRGIWSRLDRFFVIAEWIEKFKEDQEKVGNMAKLDHRMLMLQKETNKGGPRLFRFQMYWLEKLDIL